MSRRRVLHIIEKLVRAGAEHSMLNICVALKEQYDPCVAAFIGGKLEAKLAEAEIPTYVLQPEEVPAPTPWQRFSFCWRLIRQLKPDIVHTHSAYGNTLGRLAAHLQGLPTIAHIRGRGGKYGTITHKLLYRLCQRGNTRLVAISNGIGRELHRATGLLPQTIYNAVDESWFAPEAIPPGDIRKELGLPDETFLVGSLGRIVEVKNYPGMLRCAQRVCQAVDDVHCVFGGEGELLDEMNALKDSMGLAERVHFLGFRSDVARILHDIDVFLFMSHGESFGRVLVEAMWTQTPVVAARVMGVEEVVEDGSGGFLVPPDDDEAAAARVLELYHSQELRRQMGEAGYASAQSRFSIGTLAEKLSLVYEELLGE